MEEERKDERFNESSSRLLSEVSHARRVLVPSGRLEGTVTGLAAADKHSLDSTPLEELCLILSHPPLHEGVALSRPRCVVRFPPLGSLVYGHNGPE